MILMKIWAVQQILERHGGFIGESKLRAQEDLLPSPIHQQKDVAWCQQRQANHHQSVSYSYITHTKQQNSPCCRLQPLPGTDLSQAGCQRSRNSIFHSAFSLIVLLTSRASIIRTESCTGRSETFLGVWNDKNRPHCKDRKFHMFNLHFSGCYVIECVVGWSKPAAYDPQNKRHVEMYLECAFQINLSNQAEKRQSSLLVCIHIDQCRFCSETGRRQCRSSVTVDWVVGVNSNVEKATLRVVLLFLLRTTHHLLHLHHMEGFGTAEGLWSPVKPALHNSGRGTQD